MTNHINISINGFPVEVKQGKTILQAAEEQGITIPTLCYHKDLCVAGNCRVCVVEVAGQTRLSAACATPFE
jgi:NADH-quinone oxidoreductase subunit G/[NiFe] hydrogenase diaphorase moiety small subunit/NADP-reducing hydrogenase subunit HndD